MPRFFVSSIDGDTVTIDGSDAHHITRVLRMRVGEKLTVCDGSGIDCETEITEFSGDTVSLRVLEKHPCQSEPTVQVTLYQGLPKSEKMDFIVQKAVELGVARVVPVAMARSIAKVKDTDAVKKQQRWQKIAAEAAGQSGRGVIPTVSLPISFLQAVSEMRGTTAVAFYEGDGISLTSLVSPTTERIAIMIGPEGGFEPSEIEKLEAAGVHIVSLGKRILRCETAPVVALALIMQLSGNME